MNIRGLVRLVGAAAISLVLSISTVGSVAADGMVTPPALAYTIPENSSLLVPNSAMLVGQPAGVYVQTTDLTTFPPDWGKITGGATGITYVPQTDYVGHDAFSYTVCKPVSDGQPTCLTAMVTITINAPVGTPVPTASPSGGRAARRRHGSLLTPGLNEQPLVRAPGLVRFLLKPRFRGGRPPQGSARAPGLHGVRFSKKSCRPRALTRRSEGFLTGCWARKPSGRRFFWHWPALARSLQPAAGMLGTRRLVQNQKSSPQAPLQFPNRLLV